MHWGPLKLSAPMSSITTPGGPVPSLFLAQPVFTLCLHTIVHATFPAWHSLSLPKVHQAWSLWYCSDPSFPWILVLTALSRVLALAYSVIVVYHPIVPSINLTQTCIKHWLWQVSWQTLKIKKQERITRWFYLLGKTHTKVFTEMRHLCRDAPIILKSEMRVLTNLNAPRSEDSWGLLYILQLPSLVFDN